MCAAVVLFYAAFGLNLSCLLVPLKKKTRTVVESKALLAFVSSSSGVITEQRSHMKVGGVGSSNIKGTPLKKTLIPNARSMAARV